MDLALLKEHFLITGYKKENGFTLIELVIVIIVLGILSASVAPKFISLRSDTKIATLETVGAAMESGLVLVHSLAVIENQYKGSGEIQIGATTVPLYNGYPSVARSR